MPNFPKDFSEKNYLINDIRNIVIIFLLFVIIYSLISYFDQQTSFLTKLSETIVPFFVTL